MRPHVTMFSFKQILLFCFQKGFLKSWNVVMMKPNKGFGFFAGNLNPMSHSLMNQSG